MHILIGARMNDKRLIEFCGESDVSLKNLFLFLF